MTAAAAPRLTHPQLAQLVRELEAASAHAKRLAASADDRTFATKPAPAAWSAAECLAHLTITSRSMLPEIDRAIGSEASRHWPDDRPYRMSFLGALLRWSLDPPYRMKMPTTAPFVPANVPPRDVVLAEFMAEQDAAAATIARAQGHDLGRLRVTSPFNARVKYNVYAALRILLAHERRHLLQAERALGAR